MEKAEIRKIALANRKEYKDMNGASEAICRNILSLPEFMEAEIVLAYMATPLEINLDNLITECMKSGKKVAVPKIIDRSGIMEFVYIHDFKELQKGYMNILEPISNDFIDIRSDKKVLMILPGLAFDKSGNRCGYGGGYYDRYLAKGFSGVKLAVTIRNNIFDMIKTDENDEKWDILVSEENIYRRKI